ncbi:MAG: glycosyltransferase family 2 protein [Chitinophagaceae bacterium]|nr:glycosyltransferase family 2 protein [Chitinophagaceae bacterium]
MKVSIITPCYNHGKYLEELIRSVENTVKLVRYELIIINDGSTDEFTIVKLKELEQRGYKIIHQDNMGLSAARNNAILQSSGKYIVPLDADNMLSDGFVDQSVEILEKNLDFDVVYTDCYYFGDVDTSHIQVGEYDLLRLINMNYIDACSMYRKETWTKSGGYDTKMVLGYEDWDLWLNFSFSGSKFYYLQIPGFYYRVLGDSMLRSVTRPNEDKNIEYIYSKYKDNIIHYYRLLYKSYQKYHWGVNVYMKNNKIKSVFKILFGQWNIK